MIWELAHRKGHCVGRLVALFLLAIGSIAGMAVGSRAQAEMQYTPSVSLAQRYDSNVYNTAKQFVPSGSQSWDLVTTLGAKVELKNKSRLGDSLVRAAVDGNAYAYNSNLAYASTNVLASSDVSDWAHELLPGLKLRIADRFRYTPQQSPFLTQGVPAHGTLNESDIFSRGIQGVRANAYSNILSTQGEYSFSRTVGLEANYTYSISHIGRIFVSQAATNVALQYYDTTAHDVTMGPTYTLDGGDSLFLKFNYLSADQTNSSGSTPPIKFTAQSIQPEYIAKFVRGWTATISGGATIVEQGSSHTFASGGVSLMNELDRQTRVEIEISRKVAPLFIGVGGAMISNVAQLYVSHSFTRVVKLTINGNYAHNESAPVKVFTFETIRGSAVLDYKLTRSTKLSLSQDYGHFLWSGSPAFDRYMTMLAVSTEW